MKDFWRKKENKDSDEENDMNAHRLFNTLQTINMDHRVLSLTYVLQLEQGITDILKEHPLGDHIAKCLIAWGASCVVNDIASFKEPDSIRVIKICMKSNIKWLFEGNETVMKRCWRQNGFLQCMYPNKTFDDFRSTIIDNPVESEKIKNALIDYVTHFDFKQQEQSTENVTAINMRHYKTFFLPIVALIILIVIAVTALIYAGYDKEAKDSVGKYVYIDMLGVVHIDRECCFSSDNSKTKEERILAKRGVKFVDTMDFHGCDYDERYDYWYVVTDYEYCPKCITDDAYTHLHRILIANREKLKVKHK